MCKHSVNEFWKRGSIASVSEVLHNFGILRGKVIGRELPYWEIRGSLCPHYLVFPNPENRQKGLLRDVHAAYPLHALLAFLLLFQQFALAADIAAITLGNNVLTQGSNCLARDHLGPYSCLDRHLKHLPRNQLPHLGNQRSPSIIGKVAMHDDGKSIYGIARNQNVELHHRRLPAPGDVIIQRSVATGNGLQPVVEVEYDLVQWQLVIQHYPRRADVFEAFLFAALVFHQPQNTSDVFLVGQDGGQDHGLLDLGDFAGIGPTCRIVHLDHAAIREGNLVSHPGSGSNQVEIVFALQPLLDDLHVQQTQETAAETKAQRHRAFRLEEEGRIVEPQFFQGFPQKRVFVRIYGVQPGENHGLQFLETRQRFDGGMVIVGDGVADLAIGNGLDGGGQETYFAGCQLLDLDCLWR